MALSLEGNGTRFVVVFCLSLCASQALGDGTFAAGRIDSSASVIEPAIRPFDVGRSSPGLIEFGGTLYMTWRGNNDDFNLVIGRVDLQSGNFEEKITFAEATSSAPALAIFKGSLVIAWTGTDRHLRVGQVSLSERRILPTLVLDATSSFGPSLAAFPDRLILGWTGDGKHLSLGRVDFSSGIEDVVHLDDQIEEGPALRASGGSLFVAWTGTNKRLNVGYFNGAPNPVSNPTWAGRFRDLDESSEHAPSLAIAGGELRIAWTGTDDDHRLNVATFDIVARTIVGKTTFAESSDAGPSIAAAGDGLSIAWHHRPRSGHREIRLLFPNSAPKICAVADAPRLQVMPAELRHATVDIFNIVYPEIVALYGEPLAGVDVPVYQFSDTPNAMYLSHKSGLSAKALAVLVAALLELPPVALCAAVTDIPDHTLLLGDAMPDFDHRLTHEIIHTFHDPMDLLGWYDRSWIEEGMAEATAELVALRLARRGGRDVQGSGIGFSPADNLKHYDSWSYPWNGAWTGNHPGFSILGGIQFFAGGIALPPLGDEQVVNVVLDPDIRYGASAALWLMLTQRLSTDPLSPDFLRRLNEQLDRDDVREMADDSSDTLYGEIDKVVGDARIEGLPVRDWLLQQAILKGAPTGSDFLFIDVRDPEGLNLATKETRPITIFAIAKEDLSNPANPLGQLAIGELPARNCSVEVTIRDDAGHAWVDRERGKTDKDGRYVVQAEVKLPPGGYSIYATARDCDRVHEGPFQSHVPDNLSATTYAIAGGAFIGGPNAVLRGATVRPREPFFFPGSKPFVDIVGADVAAMVIRPAFHPLSAGGAGGAFTVDTAAATDVKNPLAFIPQEIELAQAHQSGRKNPRVFLKPNPFTRVVWLGTTPDFSFDLRPSAGVVTAGGSTSAEVRLTPNGVRRNELPGCPTFTFLVPLTAPPGVTVELPIGHETLSLAAPDPTIVPMKINVAPGTSPGIYSLEFQTSGSENCEPITRTAFYRLEVQAASLEPPGPPARPPGPPTIPSASPTTLLLLAATLGAVGVMLLRRG